MELQFHPGPARKTYNIYHYRVYSEWTPDDGQRNCPKYVDFHDKKNCEISASSWFYCREICYDARSHEPILMNLTYGSN